MPGLFIAAIIFAVIGLIVTLSWVSMARWIKKNPEAKPRTNSYGDALQHSDIRNVLKYVSIALWCLVGVFMFFSSMTVVSARNIGIVTEFGHPSGELSNGFHMIAPWAKVTEFNARIQTEQNTTRSDCTNVRIANQSVACVENILRWRIKPGAGDELFKNYSDFNEVSAKLVDPANKAALNEVFRTYDPLAALAKQAADIKAGVDTPTSSVSSDENQAELDQQVEAQLDKTIGSQVEVLSVNITIVYYDNSTESKLSQFQAAIAQTRIAKQNILTAEAQATANQKLSASLSHNPNVLTSKCLDTINELAQEGKTGVLPAGFTCFPGGQSSVVVPAQ
ncbi:MAG TPA: SPFH domain-containing protein [Candidatus Saccharimonadales bacterium]|nr:SPFH domain-containing protein [Candidatus Saccharimonadales bacterium]